MPDAARALRVRPPVTRLSIDPIAPDAGVIKAAVRAIRAGGIVAMPTDTLYGLAADPFDTAALAAIQPAEGAAHRARDPARRGRCRPDCRDARRAADARAPACDPLLAGTADDADAGAGAPAGRGDRRNRPRRRPRAGACGGSRAVRGVRNAAHRHEREQERADRRPTIRTRLRSRWAPESICCWTRASLRAVRLRPSST